MANRDTQLSTWDCHAQGQEQGHRVLHQGLFTRYLRAEIILLQTMQYFKYQISMYIDTVFLNTK